MSISELKSRLTNPQVLPYTHKILDIGKFLKDNQELFDKLSGQCAQPASRTVKSKSVSKFVVPRSPTVNYRERNEYLTKQISAMRQREMQKKMQDIPEMGERLAELQARERELRGLTDVNAQLKDVLEGSSDMFQMYDKMCRKCESIRKVNDDLTEEIKNCIKRLNTLTNRDQNPNLFIMNFK